ncbi:ATP-binding cassette domain-containing protein [Nocardioides panaciterrulae]|uniref:Branched-chain amino acid transport system ATP-binding protein n=1 Tax=Nocardioides panaciterrulae TaxID=661492 RepID=A0A7Y9JBL5_9ACTN|nr:branched-chain amino acid transport system ATP-binding protein [Nocardioides panaciterrulae]
MNTHRSADAPPLLTLRDVHVEVAGSKILHGISFEVAATGVTALLGRNGVGKTSTLLATMGLLPRTGEIGFDGRRIDRERTHRIVRSGIGYVPEDREVFAGLTVTENLRLAERGPQPRYDVVYELFPELDKRGRQAAGTLSGGQQQMLALGRVLLADNRLLLVDEPTKGLAPQVVQQVAVALERVAAHTPVLLVEQNLAVVRRLALRAVVLNQGRVVHDGDARALLADAALTQRLLGVSTGEAA